MPNFKIKNFSGIATNLDQDDVSPELFQRSRNAKNKTGFVESDKTKLTQYTQTASVNGIPTGSDLPNPLNFHKDRYKILAYDEGMPSFKAHTSQTSSTNAGVWSFEFYWGTSSEFNYYFMSSTTDSSTTDGYSFMVNSAGGIQLNELSAGVLKPIGTPSPSVTVTTGWHTVLIARSITGEFYVEYDNISFAASDSTHNLNPYNILELSVAAKIRKLISPDGAILYSSWIVDAGNIVLIDPSTTTWSFKKGIRHFFSEDILYQQATDPGTWGTVLIAQGYETSTSTYYYQIWLKDDTVGTWKEMSIIGNYTPTSGRLHLPVDYLKSTETGEIKLVGNNGVVKIYLPHDSFWLSKINRTYKAPASWQSETDYKGYYLDRLSEDVDLENLTTVGASRMPVCRSDKRLGVNISVTVDDTPGTAIIEDTYTATFLRTFDLGFFGRGRIYEFLDSDGNKLANQNIDPIQTIQGSLLELNAFEFPFFELYSGEFTGDYIVSHSLTDGSPTFADIISPTGADWDTAPYNTSVTDPNTSFIPSFTGTYRRLTLANITASTWQFTDGKTIGNVGFLSGAANANIITTAVLDEGSEIIMDYKTVSLKSVTESRFALSILLELPYNINKRITRVNTYIKLDEDKYPDYELVGTYDLLGTKPVKWGTSWMSEASLKGTTLAQNIGFLVDEDELYSYKLYTKFNKIATLEGVSLATISEDNTNVYYSVIGGGRLQPDIIYRANILQGIPDGVIKALNVGNNFFIVSSLTSTYVVKVNTIGSVIGFSSQKTLEEGTVSQNLTVQTQGGAIAVGYNGIYFLDGYKSTNISLYVEDVIDMPTTSDKLFYNYKDHEIVYIKDGYSEILRYRLKDKAWETLYLDEITNFMISDIEDIFSDENGQFIYLMNDSYFLYDNTIAQKITMLLESNEVSLGETGVLKRMPYFVVDYIGDFTISLWLDNRLTQTWDAEWMRRRDQKTFALKMESFRPFTTMKFKIEANRISTIYGITFNFEYLWERTDYRDVDDRVGAYLVDSSRNPLVSSTGDYLIASSTGTN